MFAALIDNLGTLLLNLLAIIGGAAAGALVTGLATQLVVKLLTKKKVPVLVLRLIRILGGIACGLLVYLLVSGAGSGFGFGGGWGLGGGGTSTGQTGSGSTETGPTSKEKTAPQPTGTQPIRPGILRVEMLGGKRYQPGSNRYYLVEGVQEPRTLDELSIALEERRKDAAFLGIEIVIYRTGSVAESTAQVKDLKDRAQKLGLSVKTTLLDQDAP